LKRKKLNEKDVKTRYELQEIKQRHRKHPDHTNLKITSPRTFQIDNHVTTFRTRFEARIVIDCNHDQEGLGLLDRCITTFTSSARNVRLGERT
jgi:uncharacterized protein YajQ (UPF0234 family)